jgi:DMSO reductase family type II enzyme chaperone
MFGYSLVGLEVDSTEEEVKEVEENETTARSAVYQVLARQFHAPTEEEAKAILEHKPIEALREAASLLPYVLENIESAPSLTGVAPEDLCSEFVRLFDVGVDGPPCPLFGGAYAADRNTTMEETRRFYDYFGLKLSQDYLLPPDHLATELDFMQYLTFKEAAATSPRLGRSYASAQKDFLERQLRTWVPTAAERLAATDPHPYYRWLFDLVNEVVTTDYEYVVKKLSAN